MEKHEDRYQKGYDQLTALDAHAPDRLNSVLSTIAPDLARLIIEFGYGDIYTRPGLDIQSRQIATIAALVALGNAGPQLELHIRAALNIDVKPEEIIETIYVATVYAGFPAALNAFSSCRNIFEEQDIRFRPAMSGPVENPKETGLKTLENTSGASGQKELDSLRDIAPDMADFIINFCYGAVFSRETLSPKHKEIAGIAAMCAAGNMQPQLKVHIQAALNVGCTKEEITEVLIQMSVYAGFPASMNGIAAARDVFSQNNG